MSQSSVGDAAAWTLLTSVSIFISQLIHVRNAKQSGKPVAMVFLFRAVAVAS